MSLLTAIQQNNENMVHSLLQKSKFETLAKDLDPFQLVELIEKYAASNTNMAFGWIVVDINRAIFCVSKYFDGYATD